MVQGDLGPIFMVVLGDFLKTRLSFCVFLLVPNYVASAQLCGNFLNSKLKHVEPLRAQNLWKVKHFEQHLEPFRAHSPGK